MTDSTPSETDPQAESAPPPTERTLRRALHQIRREADDRFVDLAVVDRPNDRLVKHVDDVERRVVFGGDGGGRDDRVGRRLAPIDGDEHEVDSERAAGHIRLSGAGQ